RDAGESLLERIERASGDLLDAAEPRDPAVGRRGGIAAALPGAEVLDQRARLRVVDGQSLAHGLLAVVVALGQRLAGDVVAVGDFRRIEPDVVGASAG